MTFLHWTLLIGAGLSVLPILFHLRSRRQPKQLVFPALRFVRETVVTAERGWKVKHWLLLSMRVLLVLLLAFALAAPRVHSNMLATYLSVGLIAILAVIASLVAIVAWATHRPKSVLFVSGLLAMALWCTSLLWGTSAWFYGPMPPTHSTSGPIAAALIIDTSPTMDYQQANKSRLDVAKELGNWLIDRFPVESEIAIIGSERGARLSIDRTTATRQLTRLNIEGKASPLAQRISAAVDLVRSSKLERREVYVLTDMRAGAWRDSGSAELIQRLGEEPAVLLQLIDVGVDSVQDWGLSGITLSQEVVAPGGTVEIQATVQGNRSSKTDSEENSPAKESTSAKENASGVASQQLTVELLSESDENTLPVQRDGKTIVPAGVVRERQMLELKPDEQSTVRFLVRNLTAGTHQFSLRIGQPDPLRLNNQLYAAVDVREHGRLLVASDDVDLGNQIAAIPDPRSAANGAPNADLSNYFRLDTVDFRKYACIALLDPPGLTDATVEKIDQFVEAGGGLLLLLGPRSVDSQTLLASPLRKLLPAEASDVVQSDESNTYFVVSQPTHPVFHPLENTVDEAGWNRLPVFQFWKFDKLPESATSLIRYSGNGLPAMIEQGRGKGRILTVTTPIPEPSVVQGREVWNELWSGTYAWQSYGLMVGSIRYLSGWGENRLNYVVGQAVVLENDMTSMPTAYTLFAPMDEVTRVEASDGFLKYPFAKSPGAYRLLGSMANRPMLRGFSVNAVAEDFDLSRVSSESLEAILGRDRFSVAREKDEVTQSIGQSRFGRELYPFAMLLLVVLLIAEQAMASRFYSFRMPKPR